MPKAENKKTGKVLVLGGGISGIQTSLDLAEMGFYVYLVEKKPAVGGRMAQLDKVFPTNDCSMCIISPKLNDIGAHINIEVLNNTELLELTGEAGNFTAKLLKKPRYLLSDKCTACGDCAKVCPVDLPNEFNENQNTRKVTYKSYAQAYPNSFSLTKESISPCVIACPAHVNAHGYVSLAGKGRFQEALETILDVLPLPGTLGRICAHPCESRCRRGDLEGALDIKNIKRLVAERGNLAEAGKTFVKEPFLESRCAIVGAGPAGLSCAYHLARRGVKSVIFEASNMTGGALRHGIPDYRLPANIIQEESDFILNFSGAQILFNRTLGRDFTLDSLFAEGFQAVFLAMGANNNIPLKVPGEELEQVVAGIEFLRRVNSSDRPVLTGKRVLVLGAGNVAMDASRSAIRLGASVTLAYRRGRGAMPAWPWEVAEAAEEGVNFLFLRAPFKFEEKNGQIKAHLVKTVTDGDPNDRRAKLFEDHTDILTPHYDLIISAAGQSASSEAVINESSIKIKKGGGIFVNPVTFETGRKGVFAGGDVERGPALAIEAVAAGKEAAISISRFLKGENLEEGREKIEFKNNETWRELPQTRHWRNHPQLRPVAERIKDFQEFDLGFTEEQAIDEASRCAACGACCQCYRCVKACLPGALTMETHHQISEVMEIQAGAVVVASGFEAYDPSDAFTYRYPDSQNIVTSLEFERILSASGPFQGHMVRPSDQTEPKKIAWIQCVGSRDINRCDKKYCSSVCCMYAMKEATVAMEHAGGPENLEASIFYMDIRAYGKDFEKYFNRAKDLGVKFIRSRIHTLTPLPDGNIELEFLNDQAERKKEIFDMAVLSIGLAPANNLKSTANKLNISLNDDGFIETSSFDTVKTTRDGIYACGANNEPKDIPASVAEAQAAAQGAAEGIASARFTETKTRSYPAERDTIGEIPRIGVFICHCGINIAAVVDVESVAAYAKRLPFVELATTNLFTCSADTQTKIKDAIIENQLNRVVVASCSPRTHEGMFRETLAQAGINKFLFEMANIRDQNSWVHQKEPEKATAKAKDLVRGAVAKAAFLEPMYLTRMDLTREALVVGGGAAGLSAALGIANLGFKTHLVERKDTLGGEAYQVLSRGKDIEGFVRELATQASKHPLIEVHLQSYPKSSEGFLGNFETLIATPEGDLFLKHGVTVLAPGGKAHKPSLYSYGKHPDILLTLDLDKRIKEKDPALTKPGAVFTFIQCVESRTPERPYCSKVCCTHTLDHALSILDLNPSARIFVIFRDMRSYGFREKKYLEARRRGVVFIRYELDNPPEVNIKEAKTITLTVNDHVLNRPLCIQTDFLTLAAGIDPVSMKEEIVEVFKGQLNSEGFLLEAHMKLRPVDMATDGQFLAGLAHSPKPIEESISQAKAAAARAAAVLAKPYVLAGGVVAVVNPDKCAVCCTCVRTCPFGVPKIVANEKNQALRGHAFMEPAICQGCGVCVSECPGKAIKLQFFTDEQLLAKVSALATHGEDISLEKLPKEMSPKETSLAEMSAEETLAKTQDSL
jgi:heterodisulfide reductase subunit A-like polyferredoxin